MTKERWQEIVSQIKDNFNVTLEEEYTGDNSSQVKAIEFENNLGRLRLEFTVQPKVVDTKTFYSNRIGSDVKTEKIYSPDETSSFLKAFKWSDQSQLWSEIKIEKVF